MLTDAKISLIQRNGFETIVTVGFYEGQVTTENEETRNGVEPVTRYRRTAKVGQKEFRLPANASDVDIRKAIKQEVKKDKTRSPIDAWL